MQISRDRLLHEAGQVALEIRIKDSYITELESENERLGTQVTRLRTQLAHSADLDLGPHGDGALMAERSRNT